MDRTPSRRIVHSVKDTGDLVEPVGVLFVIFCGHLTATRIDNTREIGIRLEMEDKADNRWEADRQRFDNRRSNGWQKCERE